MPSIRFKNAEVRKVLETNKGGQYYRLSLGAAIQNFENRTKRDFKYGTDNPSDEDYRTTQPTLLLVKDHGVYLMAARLGMEPQIKKPSSERTDLCYAIGLNPDTDTGAEQSSRQVSADDFAESFPVEMIEQFINAGADLQITLTRSQIKFQPVK